MQQAIEEQREESLRYQDAMSRLEEIVTGLERDQINVDDLGDRVKEATALLNQCRRKLTAIEDEVRTALTALEVPEASAKPESEE